MQASRQKQNGTWSALMKMVKLAKVLMATHFNTIWNNNYI